MKIYYSIVVLIGCVSLHLIDATPTLKNRRLSLIHYKDNVAFRQRASLRLLFNKDLATVVMTPTPPDKLLQNISDWADSFLLQPLESWPTPRMMHLLFSILSKTQQMMQCYDLKPDSKINTSYDSLSVINMWKKAQKQQQQQQQQWMSPALRYTARPLLVKRQQEEEEEEEGRGGEKEEEEQNVKNHEDGKEGDDKRHRGSDHQDSDSQQHHQVHEEEEEEGGEEGHSETQEDNDNRESAKFKKRYYLPSSSLSLLQDIYIELDQVSAYVAHVPLHQGDLFVRLNYFLALIHQAIAMVELNNAKAA